MEFGMQISGIGGSVCGIGFSVAVDNEAHLSSIQGHIKISLGNSGLMV